MLLLVKYGLPICLSYTLFVGIAGQFNPFRIVSRKAVYVLAAWTSLCVMLLLVTAMHMAYGKEIQSAEALVKPFALLGCLLILPAFVVFLIHRRISAADTRHHEMMIAQELSEMHARLSTENTSDNLSIPANAEPGLDASDSDPLIDSTPNPNSTTAAASLQKSLPQEDTETEACLQSPETVSTTAIDHDETSEIETLLVKPERGDAQVSSAEMIEQLKSELHLEREMRAETEKHLIITRKALSALEQRATLDELKTPKDPKSPDQLISTGKTHEDSHKIRPRKKDPEVTELRKSLANAKQEIRRGIAARAKALSTANQSIALARQALKTRSRLESELKDTRASLTNRQAAVNSLIRALDKEKRRTAEDVDQLARQMLAETQPDKNIHADT